MLKICVHIFFLRPKKPFFGKSGQKNQICQFKLKSGTKTNNLNMRNSITVISWANLGEKFKIVCSKLHLIQRLIRCLFCLFYTENSYYFWVNLVQKSATVSLS